MKKTKMIGFSIFLLLICLMIVLLFIANLTILKSDNSDLNSVGKENTKNEIKTEDTAINNTSYINGILSVEEEVGGVEYSREYLNNFKFEIKGMTNDISKYINDVDEFFILIKEYVFKNGLVDATYAEVERYEYQESTSRLGIIFKLDNTDEDKIRVIVNPNGKIDISEYK